MWRIPLLQPRKLYFAILLIILCSDIVSKEVTVNLTHCLKLSIKDTVNYESEVYCKIHPPAVSMSCHRDLWKHSPPPAVSMSCHRDLWKHSHTPSCLHELSQRLVKTFTHPQLSPWAVTETCENIHTPPAVSMSCHRDLWKHSHTPSCLHELSQRLVKTFTHPQLSPWAVTETCENIHPPPAVSMSCHRDLWKHSHTPSCLHELSQRLVKTFTHPQLSPWAVTETCENIHTPQLSPWAVTETCENIHTPPSCLHELLQRLVKTFTPPPSCLHELLQRLVKTFTPPAVSMSCHRDLWKH